MILASRRFSTSYVDNLLKQRDSRALAELAGIIASSNEYDPTQPFAGLSESLFCFIQVLSWEAQSWRSGVWTYYEATSDETQEQVALALERKAPPDVAKAYREGSGLWRSASKAITIDEWLQTNESRVLNWLCEFIQTERNAVQRLA